MAVLLACVPYAADIDSFLRADNSSIKDLAKTLEGYSQDNVRSAPLVSQTCSSKYDAQLAIRDDHAP